MNNVDSLRLLRNVDQLLLLLGVCVCVVRADCIRSHTCQLYDSALFTSTIVIFVFFILAWCQAVLHTHTYTKSQRLNKFDAYTNNIPFDQLEMQIMHDKFHIVEFVGVHIWPGAAPTPILCRRTY